VPRGQCCECWFSSTLLWEALGLVYTTDRILTGGGGKWVIVLGSALLWRQQGRRQRTVSLGSDTH